MTRPSSDVIAWKYANLFISDGAPEKPSLMSLFTGSSVDWLRRRMGGAWVGGAVTLTRDALSFGPNALNEAVHEGDVSKTLELARVVSVGERFGWLTRIVDVHSDDGETFTFRCFGARAFAANIRRALETLRT